MTMDEDPVTRPDLRAMEGGGETSAPKKGHLHSVGGEGQPDGEDDGRHLHAVPDPEENDGEDDGHFVKSDSEEGSGGKGKAAAGALGAADLAGAESEGKSFPGSQFGFNANPMDMSPMGMVKGMLTRNKKKALVGGGVGAGIAGLLIGGFFILLPLKIE